MFWSELGSASFKWNSARCTSVSLHTKVKHYIHYVHSVDLADVINYTSVQSYIQSFDLGIRSCRKDTWLVNIHRQHDVIQYNTIFV